MICLYNNVMKILMAILPLLALLFACTTKGVVPIVPTTWETGRTPGNLTGINSAIVFSIDAPAAGNYPQGLYKYPFRIGLQWYYWESFVQTLDWFPHVSKTFETNTQYTARLTLDPVAADRTFRGILQSQVRGLPEQNVESIGARIAGESLVIYIVFNKTESTNAAPQLVFYDEFDGTTLDRTKWDYSPPWVRHGRSSWHDSSDLVEVKNGILHIGFKRDRKRGEEFAEVRPGMQINHWWGTVTRDVLVNNWISAGAIRSMRWNHTDRFFEHGFGWYEARIKFPQVAGTMAAWWLMSMTYRAQGNIVNMVDNRGQFGTEIDILETIGNAHGIFDFALHWGTGPGTHQSFFHDFRQPDMRDRLGIDIYDGNFHVFALCWSPGQYVFYINDIELLRVKDNSYNRQSNGTDRFVRVNRNPNYMKLTMESAFWDMPLPADFERGAILVDYVRVFNQPRIINGIHQW